MNSMKKNVIIKLVEKIIRHLVKYVLEDFSTMDEPMCLVLAAQKFVILGPLSVKRLCTLNPHIGFDYA